MAKKPKLTHDGWGWHVSTKGYPRFNGRTANPASGQYVHRYEANKMKIAQGRGKLKESDQVHHGRGGKLDFSWANLTIITAAQHGWQTTKQCFWMKVLDIKREKEFYETIAQLEAEGVNTGL